MGCSSSAFSGFGDDGLLNDENERGWSFSIRHVDHAFKIRVFEKSAGTRALLEEKLGNHGMFSTLGPHGLSDMVNAMEPINVEPGTAMILQADLLTHLYIIEVGFLSGSRGGYDDDSSRKKSFGGGAIIGERSLLSEQTAQATYKNNSDSMVVAWRINAVTYRNILAVNGERIAHRNRVRLALASCPFLGGVESHVLDSTADAAMQVTPLDAGAPLPGVIPRQRATHAWLVVKGKVFETMALRPDGGTRTKDTHDEYVIANNRGYEAGPGQLAGTHSLLCGLTHHVGSASASRAGAEVVPVPFEVLTNGGLNRATERLLVSDLFERVLTSKPEFAAFPQAVIKMLVAAMPTRK